MILLLGVGFAAVLLPLLVVTNEGGGRLRKRDAGLVAAGVGVLSLPLVHIALLFVGFVPNPRHFAGDYFTMQRDARIEALAIALVGAAGIVASAAVGATSRPHGHWRTGIAAIEVVGAIVFAAIEVQGGLSGIAEASSRIGTIPM